VSLLGLWDEEREKRGSRFLKYSFHPRQFMSHLPRGSGAGRGGFISMGLLKSRRQDKGGVKRIVLGRLRRCRCVRKIIPCYSGERGRESVKEH